MAKRKTTTTVAANILFYQGGGHFPGIPSRDLTADEVAGLTSEQRFSLVASGLYAERAKSVQDEVTE